MVKRKKSFSSANYSLFYVEFHKLKTNMIFFLKGRENDSCQSYYYVLPILKSHILYDSIMTESRHFCHCTKEFEYEYHTVVGGRLRFSFKFWCWLSQDYFSFWKNESVWNSLNISWSKASFACWTSPLIAWINSSANQHSKSVFRYNQKRLRAEVVEVNYI